MSNIQHIKVWDLGTHTDFSTFFDPGFNLFGKYIAEVYVFAVIASAHHMDATNVGDVVSDDLAQFGKMPSVPFTGTHHVIVELFVQVIQKRHSLNKNWM